MIDVGEPEVLIPSDQLPASTAPSRSNNNLDVCDFDGKTFIAWRTAPIHFAHPQARMEVIATDGNGGWVHENTIKPGRDLREPRFVTHEGKLFLYYFPAGRHPAKFEPQEIHVVERLDA